MDNPEVANGRKRLQIPELEGKDFSTYEQFLVMITETGMFPARNPSLQEDNMRFLLQPGNLVCTLFVLGILTALAGCGRTQYGTADIQSIPPGAEVINLKDDTHLGVTPLMVTWEEDDDDAVRATVELRKAGYIEEIKTFWIKMYSTKEDADKNAQPVTVELRKRKK